jgi:protein-S-isoprenylcysteine O-methyltransferase Ste14
VGHRARAQSALLPRAQRISDDGYGTAEAVPLRNNRSIETIVQPKQSFNRNNRSIETIVQSKQSFNRNKSFTRHFQDEETLPSKVSTGPARTEAWQNGVGATLMKNLFSILRSLFFAALFIWLQMWLLPRWAGIRGHWEAPLQEPWRWLGLMPLVPGSLLMLACVWRFGTTGEGTPAPFDPPRRFVAAGPYGYVRNPMYLGMVMALIGEAVLFAERESVTRIFWYGLALAAITECLVLFYEEPMLRRKFGAEYEQYCRRVRRWWPGAGREPSPPGGP